MTLCNNTDITFTLRDDITVDLCYDLDYCEGFFGQTFDFANPENFPALRLQNCEWLLSGCLVLGDNCAFNSPFECEAADTCPAVGPRTLEGTITIDSARLST